MHTQTIALDSPASIDQSAADAIAELTRLLQEGLPVDLETFIAEHPACADRLRELAPTMQVLFDLGYSTIGPGATAGLSSSAELNPEPRTLNPSTDTKTLGDFRILREIGRGGMGVVYEAEQISLGRRVALKVLPFASMLDERQLQRFKNEARAAATLQHANIVPVFAVGCERGVHFYAMQYVEGQTLAAVIDGLRGEERETSHSSRLAPRRELLGRTTRDEASSAGLPSSAELITDHRSLITPPADTVAAALSTLRTEKPRDYYRRIAELGIQAAEALDHAHQLGIVHRDIKPANLLIEVRNAEFGMRSKDIPSPAGRGQGEGNSALRTPHSELKIWITDFGLARLPTDAGMTMTGDLIGTLRYMSPEQALAKRITVDHRTDIYSLGITLNELLALEPAFSGADRQEILRQIAFEEPTPLRRLKPAIPVELETIVHKTISKNPDDRYPTARDLADDLARFCFDQPIRAKPPTVFQRARKWSHRHKAVVATAAAVLLLGSIIGTVSITLVIKAHADADEKIKYEQAQFALAKASIENTALQKQNDLQRQGLEDAFGLLMPNPWEQMRSFERLKGTFGDRPEFRWAYARTVMLHLNVDAVKFDLPDGIELKRKALAAIEVWSSGSREDDLPAYLLAHAQLIWATHLSDSGKFADAEPLYQKAIEHFRKVSRVRSSMGGWEYDFCPIMTSAIIPVADTQRSLALALVYHGLHHAACRDYHKMQAEFAEAIQILRRAESEISKEEKENQPRALPYQLGATHFHHGESLELLGKQPEALEAYKQARSVFAGLAPDFANAEARCLTGMARSLDALGRTNDANDAYQEAIGPLESAHEHLHGKQGWRIAGYPRLLKRWALRYEVPILAQLCIAYHRANRAVDAKRIYDELVQEMANGGGITPVHISERVSAARALGIDQEFVSAHTSAASFNGPEENQK